MESLEQPAYLTRSGLVVLRTAEYVPAAESMRALADALDERRGALLASTYEYPGRYRKRAVGFVDPPLVLESRARAFRISALNERGLVLIDALRPALAARGELCLEAPASAHITGHVLATEAPSSEESRTHRASVLSVVRAIHAALASDRADALLGLYGAFGYDLVFQLEELRPRLARDGSRELVLYLPDELLVHEGDDAHATRVRYDFRSERASTEGLPRHGTRTPLPPAASDPRTIESDHTPEAFMAKVTEARAAFARGDLFEVTLSQTFSRPLASRPATLFRRLARENPSPYGFLLSLGDGEHLVGASPEMYVRVTAKRVETCPIAGTIARGRDALDDARQIRALLASEKEESELTMCTDVDRNDKARICEPGSVRVIGRRQIEPYSRLFHTVDHVEGTLRPGYDAIDALLTHMWAVTVTGAPKLDAMQHIEEVEHSPRGFYAGAVGAYRFDGSLDTGLTLRTVHLRKGRAHVRAGATLLFDSDPAAEQRECELKASAVLDALAGDAAASRPLPTARDARTSASARPLRVLLVDHRDSFVHTLADYFRQAGCVVTTLRHGFPLARLAQLDPELVVLSPGPMRPVDFALDALLGELVRREIPVFGVCLGLQGIVEHAGGALEQLALPMHGKSSTLALTTSSPLFDGLPERIEVGRYHSLRARAADLPSVLEVLASADDGTIMALRHRERPWYAVQFHPESILSADGGHGVQLVRNVVALARTASRERALDPRKQAC